MRLAAVGGGQGSQGVMIHKTRILIKRPRVVVNSNRNPFGEICHTYCNLQQAGTW